MRLSLNQPGNRGQSDFRHTQIRFRICRRQALRSSEIGFHRFEDERWDRQIESDLKAGKFDRLIGRARDEFAQGKAPEL